MPLHPVIPQVQGLRRPCHKDEPVVGQGGHVEFKGGLRTAVRRLQADPPQSVARRGWREREDPGPVQGAHRVAALRLVLSPHRHLPDEAGCGHRRIVLSWGGLGIRVMGCPRAVRPAKAIVFGHTYMYLWRYGWSS